MNKTFFISIITLLLLTNAFAAGQCFNSFLADDEDISPNRPHFTFSLNYSRAVPIGIFKNKLNGSGDGFALKLGYELKNLPLTFGLEYNFLFYDYQNIGDYYYDGQYEYYSDNDIKYYSGFDLILISFRLQPSEATLRPYLEALGGISWYYTSSDPHIISMFYEYEDDEFYGSLNNDLGLNAGVGAGLSFLSNKGKFPEILVDTGFRFLFGSKATVIKKGTIDKIDGYVEYESSKTPTNQIQFLIGFTIRF